MFNTNSNTLIKLAAMVWYTGVIVLITKSCTLLIEAYKGDTNLIYILMAFICGIVIGIIKAKYMFYNIGKRNINRINLLANPKLWQFYRKRFFVFLFSMITLGKFLAGAARGNNMALIALAVLETSIAFALLLISHCFWEE